MSEGWGLLNPSPFSKFRSDVHIAYATARSPYMASISTA
jgi:hypothetical protein